MISGRTVTLSGSPVLITTGLNENHLLHIRTEDTGITVAGTAAAAPTGFPLSDSDPQPFTIELLPGETIYADGTGDLYVLETGI